MLGKLIKNEFVQRGRQVSLLFIAEILLGVVIAILGIIGDTVESGTILETLFIISTTAMYIAIVGGMAGIIILLLTDFSKRLFKDQGYLTHTLPVKTSSIMISRIICDIAIIMVMLIVFPLTICIAFRDFSIFSEISKMIETMCIESGIAFNAGTFTLLAILTAISIFASALVFIWHFNTAYAIGHSFGTGKRLWSVIAYIILYVIGYFSLYLLTLLFEKCLENTSLVNVLEPMVQTGFDVYILSLSTFIVLDIIAVTILVVISSYVCKKHLNLE
ncbi:MAG: hypothetical protein J5962_00510 [Lachnospiraceae bacterium]|nr:hypothetical protein [Lachnospiraceae bacterium]